MDQCGEFHPCPFMNKSAIFYNKSQGRWLKSNPCNVDITQAESNVGKMAVYIHYQCDHFEVATSIGSSTSDDALKHLSKQQEYQF